MAGAALGIRTGGSVPERVRLLSRWSDAFAAERAVARRGRDEVSENAFRARAAGWLATFERINAPAVALFQPDGVEFAAALLGAWHAGKTVFLSGDTLPATCLGLQALGVAFAGDFAAAYKPLDSPEDGDAARQVASLDADSTAVVIYTSGSTGAPQALPKKLSQLATEVETLDRQFGALLADAEMVATVSHQHIYGLLFKILWPLIARRTFVAESLSYPEDIVAKLSERRNALVSSPAHLKRLPSALDWSAVRHHACAVFSSAGPLALDAAQLTESLLGHAPFEVFGSSETGGVAWRQRSGGREQPWTPLPGVAVRDERGTLAVKSPHQADNDWHVAADKVAFGADGRFELLGRADRIAKIEGKRVSLAGIEVALVSTSLISEARVVQLDTGRDELGAVVVPSAEGWEALRRDGAAAVRRALTELLAESTERVALPRRWRWVDAMPADSQGKSTVAALSALFSIERATMPEVHVVERATERVVLELRVPLDLVYYDGHFDQAKVLPGVAQVDWAIALGRKEFRFAGTFVRLERVKFHRLYRPGPLLTLELDWRAERESLAFKFTSASGPHSSGRVVFAR